MNVATTGAVPALTAVNDDISPDPLAARPMLVVLFAHVKLVVPTVLLVEKITAPVLVLLQTTWLAG